MMTNVSQHERPNSSQRKTSIFIGGPIQWACSAGGFEHWLQQRILRVIQTLRGVGHRIYSAHLVEEFGDKTRQWTPRQVAARDYHWMQCCDVFVAVLPQNEQGEVFRTDGTHIELGWASALGKPVLLIACNPISEGYSHLVRGLSEVTRLEVLDGREAHEEPAKVAEAVERLLDGVATASQKGSDRGVPELYLDGVGTVG
jgi:hypothetical protein